MILFPRAVAAKIEGSKLVIDDALKIQSLAIEPKR
jgi:hypothetical protein